MEPRAQPWALGFGVAGAAILLAAAAVAAKKRGRSVAGARKVGELPAARPGDEAAPGTPQTGEGLCPVCAGKGRIDGRPCATCAGTGTVIVNIGDA